MRTLSGLAVAALPSMVLVGCAAPHYNLDVRNMTSEPVKLDLVSTNPKIDGGAERVVASGRVAPGSTVSMFTEGKQGDRKPQLRAQVDGDTQSPPAKLDISSGLINIDIFPAPANSGERIRLREVIR
jgi:hypothetical protein